MRYRVAALLLLVSGFTSAVSLSSGREPRFLSFSAKNKRGIFLRDLKPAEVTLLIDGSPIEVRYFGYDTVDTAFAFLLENSPRTAQFPVSQPQFGKVNTIDVIRYHLLDGIMSATAARGPVLLAEFDKKLNILQDFTTDDWQLEDVMNRIEPNYSGLGQQDIPVGRMIGRGVDILRNRSEKRKILVLFTTIVDKESLRNLAEYRQMLRVTDIDLYVVAFAPNVTTAHGYSHEARINPTFFRQLVSETSGRFYLSGQFVFPDEFMSDLEQRLKHSYTVGFYVTEEDEPAERKIKIQISRPKIKVDVRDTIVY